MNNLKKIMSKKLTENGDISYKTTGNNLTDLMFLTAYFEKHLDEAHIGNSEKEKLFSMYIRDPRFGIGKRDLGRVLMAQSEVSANNIVKAGRFDDLYMIGEDNLIDYLKEELYKGNELAKKWCPRLTGKDKEIAKALCKMWNISEKEYRKLIKTDSTVEYKLSYAKNIGGTPLDELFKKGNYVHPLVDKINFEQVPSLAMTKYLTCFSKREDIKNRFNEYMKAVKENKAKVNVSTANVYDASKVVRKTNLSIAEENADILGKKIVENETLGVEMNAICILDTSGSMGSLGYGDLIDKATALAHALALKSTYAPNQIISFSSNPRLMAIKGSTLKEQYQSMYTGDCSNTDFGKVMNLLQGLNKYPEYIIVLSDMEFDSGSNTSKDRTMKIFKEHGAETKIIWWNLNDRNKTVPEFDEYGNIYLSGYNLQMLKLLENKFDMNTYIDKILKDYAEKINY